MKTRDIIHFPDNLKKIIEKKGYRNFEYAKKIGKKPSYLNHILSGETSVGIRFVLEIANLEKVSVDWLLSDGEGEV